MSELSEQSLNVRFSAKLKWPVRRAPSEPSLPLRSPGGPTVTLDRPRAEPFGFELSASRDRLDSPPLPSLVWPDC